MKKIIQIGLIVSALSNLLVAAFPLTKDLNIEVTDASAFYAGSCLINKDKNVGRTTFKMTYAGEVVTDAVFDYISTTNNMSLKGFDTTRSDEGIYTLYVSYKEKLPSCMMQTIFPVGKIDFMTRTSQHSGRNTFKIEMPNCFDESDMTKEINTSKKYHFETKHPYKNNTKTTKTFLPLCPQDAHCPITPFYLVIKGKTEKDYDFITISQGSKELVKLSGDIDKTVYINSDESIEITFSSDYSINKGAVTVDLVHGYINNDPSTYLK